MEDKGPKPEDQRAPKDEASSDAEKAQLNHGADEPDILDVPTTPADLEEEAREPVEDTPVVEEQVANPNLHYGSQVEAEAFKDAAQGAAAPQVDLPTVEVPEGESEPTPDASAEEPPQFQNQGFGDIRGVDTSPVFSSGSPRRTVEAEGRSGPEGDAPIARNFRSATNGDAEASDTATVAPAAAGTAGPSAAPQQSSSAAASTLEITGGTIGENAPDSTPVGTVTVADPVAGETYSFALSNDAGGRFAIDQVSGVITVADGTLLDYETVTAHTIGVVVTDTGGATVAQSFSVSLNDDTSEFTASAISDSDPAADTVSESAADGASVGITALATDADASDTVSYSLSDDAGGRFVIDGTTGVISVADSSLLDYESATSHTVEVTATSTDGSFSTQNFTVNLTDDTTEAAVGPVSDSNASANSVSESAANGTVVGVTALATDADATDTISYSLSDDAGGRFAVDSTTGVVTVADNTLLDYEADTSHTVQVTATSTDGSTSVQTFTVNLTDDTAEATVGPVTDDNAEANTISESAANGAAVGITALATDADATDSVTYSLSNNAGGRFAIDGTTGVITVANSSLLDYETATSHTVEVTATSTDGSTSVQSFTVNLTDDTAEAGVGPITDSNASSNTISESAVNGTAVGITALADDADASDTVSYSLSEDAGGRFAIDGTTGVITVADSSQLDYEAATSHTVEVTATSTDGSTSVQSFTVNLTDDTAEAAVGPVTDANASANTISESAVNGTAVGVTALATDADATDTVSYSLSNDAGGRFAIDGTTGVITVADSSQLDYEAATFHIVEVTATSTDGSTSVQSFTVNLTDDTAEAAVGPVSDSNAVANTISEDTANGTAVHITALATDADASDTVSYALSDDASGRFAIDSSTGVVTVADNTLLDYETATSHTIEITATSTDGSTSVQSFTINLTDDTAEAAVGPVTDANAEANTISETVANGTAVGITALATDADATDTVSYSLSNNAGGRFAIDGTTGVITVANSSLLDYESATSHTVEVTATSTDGSTSVQSFTVNLTDDTAEAQVGPVTDSNASANTVSESAVNGTAVGVTALAVDADATDTVSYSLSDDAGGRFAIDGTTGVITVADSSQLDYEAATSHTVEVTATSTDGSTSVQSFTVNLTDDTAEAAVGPVSDSNASANTISESAVNGTAVGVTALATDADASDTVSYSLSNDAGGRFAIDASTGVITVADSSQLDYEAATSHSVEVTATSTDGSTSVQSFTINLTDDTAEAQVGPVTDSNAVANTISESAANGTQVHITARATDADATDSVSYSLSDDAGGRFAIDSTTGVITVADSSQLDYEAATSHTLEVTATSTDGSTSVQSFTVNLTDDTAEAQVGPVTDSNAVANTVSESAANGTAVGITALASDADATDTVSYSLSNDAGGRFAIDASTGVITVADGDLLDYETATSHTVEVTATSTDGSTSVQSFTVNLTDDPAEDGVGPISDSNASENSVSESAVNGTAVGITALASDPDIGDTVSYSLSNDAGGRFAIDGTTGVITVADSSQLDYEAATSHTVEVTATSTDGSTSTQSFTVNLTDDTSEAQVGPVTDSNASANTVSESAVNGTAVGITALASDADATDTVSYSLSDNAGGRFAIDASSGVISVADNSLLDYETATSHTLEVTATSTDGSTSVQSFTVNLTDDTAEAGVGPISDSNASTNSVSESAANGTAVGVTALATDADATDTVSYSLSDDASGRFAIDASTGVITVADSSQLDYEAATSHTLEVTATSTDGSTSIQSFTVNLTDDTSEAQVGPVTDSNTSANTVAENAANGTAVGITALAADADATDSVSYSLSNNAGGRFAIDGTTGIITVADNSLLDYEAAPSHTVEVTATSTDGSTSVQSFTVNLTDDTSESAVGAISDSNAAANSVSESAVNGTAVGITALASDDDETDTVSYSLSNDAGGRFDIDASTGVITVADNTLLDYETATSHTVEVTATSTDGSTSVQSFTVNLTDDTLEASVGAVSDSNAAANTISESAVNGTAVGITALATDADPGDTVSYSLSDDAGGRFAIDGTTGVITVADSSQLDYESATSHTVEVTATSTDGSTSTQSFTVNLTDDTSEAQVGPVTDSNASANTVSESAVNGTAVGVTALATDADATDTVSYSLSDDAGGRFAIDGTTGVITVADSSQLDYETATSHTVEVTATSTDGSTSVQSFTVNLTDDTSESAVGPVSDSSAAANEISELASNGTAVGVTALAADADPTDTVTYSLSDNAGGRFAIDGTTGVITVANNTLLDYETDTSHTVQVTATSTDGSTAVQNFTINILDADESSVGAISDTDAAAEQVSESAVDGTTVGVTAFATDPDGTDTVSYSLSDDAGGRFEIDSNSGVVTVADSASLDYETATSHTIEVTATSTDGSTNVRSFTINLTDDTSEYSVGAVSDSDAAANTVSESAANGTAVGITALAADADGTDTVTYSLSDDAGGRFAIDGNTGVITVADSSQLDYEAATSHTLEVTATSTDGSTSVQSFTVNLTDDTSEAQVGAISDSNASANTVSESAVNGTAVGVTALAVDADPTDTVSYSLSDDAGGRFAIDGTTGVITVADSSQLDYESATSHTVEVTATSTDGSTSVQSFTVNLTDDTSEAQVGAISDSNAAANTVSESAVNGTAVGVTALATDADVTDTVSYSLSDDASGRFAIDGTTGVITVADSSQLDYETATSHTVEVTATSTDGSTSVQSFTINLSDDASEASVGPVTDSNAAANSVSESAPNGTAVGVTALATDADGSDTVSYSLTNNAGGRFAIDASTGVINVADNSLLDYETATSHTVEVTATSTDGSTSVQSFTVNLTDDTSEAQVGAISDSNASANTVSESAVNGTAVGVTALATDADATDTVSYSLSDDAGGRFAIDGTTGVITVADSSQLDYESATSHTVEVTATSTDGSTSVQSFTVNLTDDTAESAVGAVSDANAGANTISESAANGAAVGITALANDADATDTVSYSLSDDAGGRFDIDAGTGVITVADNTLLDYETATSHTVEVTATSTDGSTSVQSFTVNLTDDTSEAQVGAISDSNASANTVSESATNGTAVGITALAADADATDTVSYSLSDDAGGRFAIDGTTGVITVADGDLLDYETATSHTVEVTATSTDGSTSVQSFTVNLTDDTAEAAVGPVSDANASANTISESAINGTAVGVTALATDADASDTVSYSLSDDAGGRFAIDASTGVVTVANSSLLDYETATSHTVEVTATSTDGSTSVQSFTVNLTDDTAESAVGPVSDSNASANTISESAVN
ncbi:MAG: cadherin repeat domain-containing protein, partial [Kiloniellales bacterium]|nr:cadherin repeat domain-containing protein [Kiloniellales bacterium]